MINYTERDKFLTEAMGEEWHKCDGWDFYCDQCESGTPMSADFSTWEGFGKLWNFCMNQEWFHDLNHKLESESVTYNRKWVNPDIFADAVYNYLKENK